MLTKLINNPNAYAFPTNNHNQKPHFGRSPLFNKGSDSYLRFQGMDSIFPLT